MPESKVSYLCDGKAPDCKKENCYTRGGTCSHTGDINHAVNFNRWEPDRKELRVCFLCDGRQACRNSEECHKNGGTCRYTFKIERAANFISWGGGRTYSENEPNAAARVPKKETLAAALVGFTAGIILMHYLPKKR